MTFLNSETRFEAVELLPVLPDGTEDLAGLDGEGDPAVGGAVGDLSRGLAGGRLSEQLEALLGLLDEDQPAAGVAVLHVVGHLSGGVETEGGGGGQEGLHVNVDQAAANILAVRLAENLHLLPTNLVRLNLVFTEGEYFGQFLQ